MSTEKKFTGFAKDKKLKFGTITQLSWREEDLRELLEYVNESGYVNVDLMRSREGKPYMQINDYGVVKGAGSAPIATPAPEDDVPY